MDLPKQITRYMSLREPQEQALETLHGIVGETDLKTATVEDVLVPASITWVTPTSQTKVVQGEALALTWEIHQPSPPSATVDLLLSSRADQEWHLIATGLGSETRGYLWDTSDYELGRYRFGIRLLDGEDWSVVIPSDWSELLASDITVHLT